MGLLSDYIEKLRENSKCDPILLSIPTKRNQPRSSWHTTGFIEALKAKPTTSKPLTASSKTTDSYSALYLSSRTLLDLCIFREQQLLSLQRKGNFSFYVVQDTIEEYISLVRQTMQNCIHTITQAKQHLNTIPTIQAEINEVTEREVAVRILVDTLFLYLQNDADFDHSHNTQLAFSDLAFLITELNDFNTAEKKPKEICQTYYERAFTPTYESHLCQNCEKPLYKGFPYCFNCFERN